MGDVAAAMDKQLQQGQKEYKDGNTAGSTSYFMAAYNEIYVASNFTQVVTDNIGSDKQASQQQAFQDIQDLSYVTGNEAKIEQSVTALVSDLDSTAKQLDANTKLANPRGYDKALQEQIAKERKVLAVEAEEEPRQGRPQLDRCGQRDDADPRQGLQVVRRRRRREGRYPRQRRLLPVLREARLREERDERRSSAATVSRRSSTSSRCAASR